MKGWCATLALLLLAACHTAADWSKAGIDASATASEYEDCRSIAETAVGPETGIDEDINATRQADIGRSSFGRIGAQNVRDETRDRTASIIASCMKAKGFAPAPGPAGQPRR